MANAAVLGWTEEFKVPEVKVVTIGRPELDRSGLVDSSSGRPREHGNANHRAKPWHFAFG